MKTIRTACYVITLGLAAAANAQCPISWDLASPGVPSSPSDPPIRQNHAAAYDSVRNVMVVFGGQASNINVPADTYTWNGTAWSLAATTGPGQRSSHAMAFDAARGRVVLFGGNNAGALGDTWEWDGSNWTQAAPAASPPGRFNHALAFDSVRNVIVLTGGFSTVRYNDTWEYDGVTWKQRTDPGFTNYVGRNGHGMVFDESRGRMVIFGGFGGSPLSRLADTWELGATGWTQVVAPGPVGRQYLGGLVYSPDAHLVYMFGGQSGPASADRLNDVWSFNGTAWTQEYAGTPAPNPVPPSEPNRRDQHTSVYDRLHRQLVVFGGYQGAGLGAVAGDTWVTVCAPCYPDCNADGVLNLADFGCFQTKFALGDPYADCNGDLVLNLSDFGCFQTKFALGCP